MNEGIMNGYTCKGNKQNVWAWMHIKRSKVIIITIVITIMKTSDVIGP